MFTNKHMSMFVYNLFFLQGSQENYKKNLHFENFLMLLLRKEQQRSYCIFFKKYPYKYW